MLHNETIDINALALLQKLQSIPELAQTRLVGGTALALQLGHRISVDLDLFGDFDSSLPLEMLIQDFGKRIVKTVSNRLMQFFDIDNIKVDIVKYTYPWLKPFVFENGIRLASIEDIAAMKINAIINRGTMKDFIDINQLLSIFTLKDILAFYCQKYDTGDIQLALRSLTYFEDAELDAIPKMLIPFDWQTTKESIKKAVREFEFN